MSNLASNDDIDWEQIYPQLYAYVDKFLKTHTFFRGSKSDSILKGRQIDDYVEDAIEKYLTHPEKYKPEKGRSLVEYIKHHILRSLLGDDLRSAENRTSRDIFAYQADSEESTMDHLEHLLPFAEASFDGEMDYVKIMDHVGLAMKGDREVEEIFLGKNGYGLKRSQIIEEFEMTEKDYDNGARRLETILKNAALKFTLK